MGFPLNPRVCLNSSAICQVSFLAELVFAYYSPDGSALWSLSDDRQRWFDHLE